MPEFYSISEIEEFLDIVNSKVVLFLKLVSIMNNITTIFKQKNEKIPEDLNLLYDKYKDNFLLLDMVSELDIYSSAIAKTLLEIRSYGAIVAEIDKGYLSWPGKIAGKEIYWCWQLGEKTINYWSNFKDNASLRFELAN